MQALYVVYAPETQKLPTACHPRRFLANKEANRLAKKFPGRVFEVWELTGVKVGELVEPKAELPKAEEPC